MSGQGKQHWILQRVSAIILAPLSVWLIINLIGLSGTGYEGAKAFLTSPLNATLLIVFVLSFFYHSALGLQVIIEDYVHNKKLFKILMLTSQVIPAVLAVYSVISILKI